MPFQDNFKITVSLIYTVNPREPGMQAYDGIIEVADWPLGWPAKHYRQAQPTFKRTFEASGGNSIRRLPSMQRSNWADPITIRSTNCYSELALRKPMHHWNTRPTQSCSHFTDLLAFTLDNNAVGSCFILKRLLDNTFGPTFEAYGRIGGSDGRLFHRALPGSRRNALPAPCPPLKI